MQGKIFAILLLITFVLLLNSVSYAVSPVVAPLSSYAIKEGVSVRIASNSVGKLNVIVPSCGRIVWEWRVFPDFLKFFTQNMQLVWYSNGYPFI